jgi:UDP-3-O-[3-hydroxymyristoyl] glucosamine N-acyltransferase
MYQLKKFEFTVSDICSLINVDFIGNDILVNKICRLGEALDNAMLLCDLSQKDALKKIKSKCLVFCSEEIFVKNENITFILSKIPEVLFFQFLNDYLVQETEYIDEEIISKSSIKFPNVDFGYNVKIGKNIIIAPGTKIGSNTVLCNNTVIRSNVEIGEKCLIKDNCVIGSEGFGFIKTNEGVLHIPQIGHISIGNDVVIGSCSTVEKPMMGYTIIHDNVKIDDLVQIGQNQEIGANTIIATGFKAEAGVKIGSDCYIGMGVTIISGKIVIGNLCIIGAGTVILKSVPDNKMIYNKYQQEISDVGEKIDKLFLHINKIR